MSLDSSVAVSRIDVMRICVFNENNQVIRSQCNDGEATGKI